jgi:alpha-ketoglutarate-dependent taurine dioxygenase
VQTATNWGKIVNHTTLGAASSLDLQDRATSLSADGAVSISAGVSARTLPAVIRPAKDSVNLASWAVSNRESISHLLDVHGALLFRGFPLSEAAQFEAFFGSCTTGALPYKERSSPRHQVQGNVYTSTDYPQNYEIFVHNEQSYNKVFSSKIAFFCQTVAVEGGETPLADTRKVYARIDPRIRESFAQKYMYVRNFGDGFGLSWQDAFQTSDRTYVERYCSDHDIQPEWKSGNRLRTRQVRPLAMKHPRTKEMTWFNHFTFFHISTLDPLIQEQLRENFTDADLPNNTYFADGRPVDDEIVEHLRDAYESETTSCAWQVGDVLLVDNLIVSHGRRPFRGKRAVLVAMGEPLSWDEVSLI